MPVQRWILISSHHYCVALLTLTLCCVDITGLFDIFPGEVLVVLLSFGHSLHDVLCVVCAGCDPQHSRYTLVGVQTKAQTKARQHAHDVSPHDLP